ncbi:uncharacterized protein LOC133377991 [Rhineura floridana]|uniref:uncharacterized protein LOC133377991 n=1 Tax=Rhineura floridana TaxID=261503 RepID=UPI002AC87237|nr:uncharacterized protein LOC133377991 [Rhineura floridana]
MGWDWCWNAPANSQLQEELTNGKGPTTEADAREKGAQQKEGDEGELQEAATCRLSAAAPEPASKPRQPVKHRCPADAREKEEGCNKQKERPGSRQTTCFFIAGWVENSTETEKQSKGKPKLPHDAGSTFSSSCPLRPLVLVPGQSPPIQTLPFLNPDPQEDLFSSQRTTMKKQRTQKGESVRLLFDLFIVGIKNNEEMHFYFCALENL